MNQRPPYLGMEIPTRVQSAPGIDAPPASPVPAVAWPRDRHLARTMLTGELGHRMLLEIPWGPHVDVVIHCKTPAASGQLAYRGTATLYAVTGASRVPIALCRVEPPVVDASTPGDVDFRVLSAGVACDKYVVYAEPDDDIGAGNTAIVDTVAFVSEAATAGVGPVLTRSAAVLSNTLQILRRQATKLYRIYGSNEGAATGWLQIYKDDTGTAMIDSIRVPAGGTFSLDVGSNPPIDCPLGLSYASSSQNNAFNPGGPLFMVTADYL